jgi:D-Tyr-tRNAtyr deacylase
MTVDGRVVGAIGEPGLLVLVGVTNDDTQPRPRNWPDLGLVTDTADVA